MYRNNASKMELLTKEIASDLGIPAARHGNLETWARQGVLLAQALWI